MSFFWLIVSFYLGMICHAYVFRPLMKLAQILGRKQANKEDNIQNNEKLLGCFKD